MSHPFDDTDALLPATAETAEFEALGTVMRAIQPLSSEGRLRVLAAISAFLGKPGLAPSAPSRSTRPAADSLPGGPGPRFSEDRTPSPKEFLFEKKPNTDVERIACLAYYLTHYRDTPVFKTLDLSKLNTEAAQLKLSNAAHASDNATRTGFLVPASKGAKQISAIGELYVQALPDRNAAREAIAHSKPKRRRGKPSKASASSNTDD